MSRIDMAGSIGEFSRNLSCSVKVQLWVISLDWPVNAGLKFNTSLFTLAKLVFWDELFTLPVAATSQSKR